MVSLPRFEIFSGDPGKTARWIEVVEGLAKANDRMQQLAAQKPGKYWAVPALRNVASISPITVAVHKLGVWLTCGESARFETLFQDGGDCFIEVQSALCLRQKGVSASSRHKFRNG